MIVSETRHPQPADNLNSHKFREFIVFKMLLEKKRSECEEEWKNMEPTCLLSLNLIQILFLRWDYLWGW